MVNSKSAEKIGHRHFSSDNFILLPADQRGATPQYLHSCCVVRIARSNRQRDSARNTLDHDHTNGHPAYIDLYPGCHAHPLAGYTHANPVGMHAGRR